LNKIADIDPQEWAIIKDKLYLNNGFLAQTLWSFDKSGNIARGDQNWPLVPKLGVSVRGVGGNSGVSARRAQCPKTWSSARA
jgi:hypothetical protein